jgi:hypothetical protein
VPASYSGFGVFTRFIVKGEVKAGVSAGTLTVPLSVLVSLLSLLYNAAYILTDEISLVELLTIVPVIMSESQSRVPLLGSRDGICLHLYKKL